MGRDLVSARSFLFVPGDRPERFDKAAASGADVVVIDLEDAVAPEDKPAARENARQWLAAGGQAVVRVNALGTEWHDDDLAAARGARAVMVPKAERDLPAGVPVIALVETARGVRDVDAVCAAPGVVRLAFGSVDLATQLGVDHRDHDALRHARSTLVLAAAAAGLPGPVDGATTDLRSAEVLDADLRHAAALGFTAKLCVHPNQVAAVNTGLAPSAEELAWARGLLAAVADGAVARYDGQMVDRPVLERARALLARAGAP
ncbi:HpcH/HpaI aldolase/citrate lyase family protein [Actinokineospora pegani]|uniref:HpcH/HpaI aldolase/citrate lyase family protein n=1 Tax=Actinokineospora pegani TaxID=2654637 RepID=UPI0012E9DB06|nr:CoA ester lyase [Actinokineospora pegani]